VRTVALCQARPRMPLWVRALHGRLLRAAEGLASGPHEGTRSVRDSAASRHDARADAIDKGTTAKAGLDWAEDSPSELD
jgi:hypothetical protein